MPLNHARTPALLVFAVSAACALSGCEVVDPADSDTSSASAPPRPTSSTCRLSPTLVASAPAQVNGAFCFGVAGGSGNFLVCAQRDGVVTECVDEVAGVAYLVRWTGSSGTVVDVSGTRQLGSIRAAAAQAFEVAFSDGQALRAQGVCSLETVSGTPVAKYCPYTN